jgi:hypothetical protein
MYAKRANSHTVEVDGASHSVYESHPIEVAKLIIEAASQAAIVKINYSKRKGPMNKANP